MKKVKLYLSKTLQLKIILKVFIFLLIADFIFQKIFGKNYSDSPLSLIAVFILFYVIIGFAAHLVRAIEKSKRYNILGWLALISVILFFFLRLINDRFPSWTLLLTFLFTLLATIFVSGIILLFLQIVKIRKSHAIALFNKIRLHKTLFGVSILFLVVLAALIYYENAKIQALNNRLEKIETKLGGPERIDCNEPESVAKIRPSVVRVVGGEGEGSGFSIGNGLILTNFHVIEFEPSPKVIFLDNAFETAKIIMANKDSDLAILKIEKDLPVISWGDPASLQYGEELLMMGYPFGGDLSGEATLKKGYLSSTRYSKDAGIWYIQTDATINPGMSGGPMVNICGEVVGINTLGTSGMGFAITSNSIKEKWLEMSSSQDSLKDIQRIAFDDTTSAEFAVATFYNYLKVRKLEKAFELLSDNFKEGHGFDYWKQGYASLLDTTVIIIGENKDKKDRVDIKLATKDMVDDEIVYKYFEGYWDVKSIDGKWRLWEPKIKEVENPDYMWFYE